MIERWIKEEFSHEPVTAVDDLISGRAGVGSNLRLDLPELLYQAFPKKLTNERAQLNTALLTWMCGMREHYAEQVKHLGFSVYGKRVCDVLIALQLLDLPEAIHEIRAELTTWLNWLEPLRLAPERDPALECLRLLTREQRDARHAALWLRLAVDPRPEYLTVALAGLQLLPNQGNAQTNHKLMLQALLRHAVRTEDDANAAHTFFSEHFAALRGFFPRDYQHWRQVLGDALDGFLEHTQEQAAKKLADTLRTSSLAEPNSSSPARVARPATQDQWGHLLNDVLDSDHRSETLARRLFELLEQNHRYAKATGVSHFFVRTLHNVGTRLLERHQLGRAEMKRFGVMIERALVWEPSNPYCWMLWADWFRVQGHGEGHESTLREMLRLFPNDAHARVELGRLLIAQGEDHWDEAEHWLRQAMERAPDSAHARVELGRLLIARGEGYWDEAEHCLRQAMERAPDSGHARVVMARLLALSQRHPEAETMLAKFLERYPDNPRVQQSLDRLRAGGAAAEFSEDGENTVQNAISRGDQPAPLPNVLKELVRRGDLASEFSRAQIAKANGHVASTSLIKRETKIGDPLAGFYSQWLMPDETPECPPHAWAWNACRYWQQPTQTDGWQHLAEQFPEAHPETEFLRVLAGPDDDNRSGAAEWRNHYCRDDSAVSRPVDVFMRKAQERLADADARQRREIAVELMACAAAGAPEFGLESAA